MIFYNYIVHNGKVYEAYYDKENNKSRFFLDGVEASGEDLLSLNKKYNTLKEFKFSGSSKLIVGIIATCIAVGSFNTLNAGIGDNDPIFKPPTYAMEEYDEEEEEYSDYEDESIEDADVDRSNFYEDLYEVSGDNQQYVSMMERPIRDYSKYMLYEDLIDTIGTLEVTSGKTSSMKDDPNVMGQYEESKNKITINSDIDDLYSYETTCHEMFHYLSRSGLCKNNSLFDGYIGNTLNEGVTQTLVNEYFNGSDNIYPNGVAYAKAITELVGKDVMLEAYFSNDLDYLISNLSQYVDEDEVYSLLKNMDDASINYDSYVIDGNNEDLINLENNNRVIWNIIGDIYKQQNNRSIESDRLMMAYKSATTLEDYLGNDVEDIISVSVDKGYFSDDYIYDTEDKYVVHYYTKNDGVLRDYIEEDNRYTKSSKSL